MSANVAVQFGARYYGPPLHAVHNHGVMANLAVLAAAQLLGRTAWRDKAIGRLRSEAPQAWTRAGMTWEQSTGYHRFNINLWNSAADAIAKLYPKDRTIALIHTLTGRASRVYAWLTEPDGKVVLIGDADEVKGETRSTWTTRVFRDDQAGLVVGRWSWRDAGTTYYTLRYGPPKWAHGQQDRVGVTWTARSRRVLVNPGRATDTSGYQSYVAAPVSHNVAYPAGSLDTHASPSVSAETIRGPAHSWALVDRLFGVSHVRGVVVDDRNARLTVSDSFGGGRSFRQKWHLDPTWSLVSRSRDGKRLTFTAGRRTLVVATTGVVTEVVRGRTRPQAGWHFPLRGQRVAAYEITVTWTAGRVATAFTVR